MKRIAESKIFMTLVSWIITERRGEGADVSGKKQRILIDHVHDRKGALYQGGTEVKLTREDLTCL